MEKSKIKKLALEAILLSMEAIKTNLEITTEAENIAANAKAMTELAEAFVKVKGA